MASEENLPTSSSSSVEFPAKLKYCRVCGKPASGQHYGIQSCHGCKSFFRRATLKNIRYLECSRDKACYSKVDPHEIPSKCSKCRIEKCFSVGMVPYFAQRPNKERTLTTDSFGMSFQRSTTKEEAMCRLIEQLSHIDLQVDKFRKSAYNPVVIPNLEEIIQSPPRLSLAEKYGPMGGWPLTREEYSEKKLELQKRLINNSSDKEGTRMVNETLNYDSNIKTWVVFDIITEIEYAKTFNFFHQLSKYDQLILIQETTVMNMYMTAAFHSFSLNFDEIHKPDGVPTSFILSSGANSVFAFQEQKMAGRTIGPMIREKIDRQEYLLLKALTLCNGSAAGLSAHGRKIVEKERHKYSSALFTYCMTRFGVLNGPARFYTVLSLIGGLVRTQNDFRSLALLIAMYIRETLKSQNENFVMPRMLQHELMKI